MVRVGSDVRRLLKQRMEMWKSNTFEALLCEAERCAAQWRNRQPRLSDEIVVRVFTRLMLRGRVHEAVCFVTDWARGGVLKPSDILMLSLAMYFRCAEGETPSPWLGFSGCICIIFGFTFAC